MCYRVNIPAATASSGSGDIFVQVTGPSNLQWLGIGQGTQMRGANIFMIYSNEAGNNVTVSPRLGAGQRQPSTSGATSQITLLAGSGIADGEITANFKCKQSKLTFTSVANFLKAQTVTHGAEVQWTLQARRQIGYGHIEVAKLLDQIAWMPVYQSTASMAPCS